MENSENYIIITIITIFSMITLFIIILGILNMVRFNENENKNKNKNKNENENLIMENIYLNSSKEITIKLNVSNKTNFYKSFKSYLKKINGEIIELIIGEYKKFEDNCILMYGISPDNIIIENGDIIKLFYYGTIIFDKDENKDFIINDKING